ncbi:MAG: acyl-protein synthetase [Methylococcaceae bacterium]|nr:acyl-protein synthetase [Methylococcaceae bacterium]
MSVSIPLETMTVEEKILAMELIWENLSAQASNIITPKWHEDILGEREKALQQGIEQPIDWEIAKKNLRNKLNEN